MRNANQFHRLFQWSAVYKWLFIAGAMVAPLPATGLLQAGTQEQEKILYIARQANGKFNVCIMNRDGSGQTNLTKSDVQEMDPAWSPDRKKIAFMVIDKKNQGVDLFVMNADGTGRTRLTKLPGQTFPHSPCWSPGGQQILFAVGSEPGPKGFSKQELWVVDADGKNLAKLGPGIDPSWSPDGKTILFTAQNAGSKGPRLQLMDADGKNVRTLTREQGEMGKWSPDGKHIVCTGIIGKEEGIVVMNADGTGARIVRKLPGVLLGFGAQWSRDARHIYFNRTMSLSPPRTAIFVMNADGKELKALTAQDAQSCLGHGCMRLMITDSKGAPERDVTAVQTWTGKVADKSLEKKKPATGFLVTERAFADLWRAWRGKDKLPTVDFDKNLVTVVTGKTIFEVQYGVDGQGNLLEKVRAELRSTEVQGFTYFIAVLPRVGIKSVNGRKIPDR